MRSPAFLRGPVTLFAVIFSVAAGLLVTAGAAVATPGPVYGDVTLTSGNGGNYAGTMTLAPGFPTAEFTSNASNAQVPSGASTYLTADTDFGEVFGSSVSQGYLNLRPNQNNADNPSVTTYTFSGPTPSGGWGFMLGDIDADQVQVAAIGGDGLPVAVADLGFRSVFNYCDTSPRSSGCSSASAPYDLPTWDPATATLVGNPGKIDTFGASGWFEPTVPLLSLTFKYTWRSGFPVYQTWFATLTRALTGTVTMDGTDGLGGVALQVIGPDDTVVGSATTNSDGTYGIDGLAPGNYPVRAVTPDGYLPVGSQSTAVDLTSADATDVDFDLTVPSYPASGTVTWDGTPIADVRVSCLDPGGAILAVVSTNSAGVYACPPAPSGAGYTVELAEPDGFVVDGPEILSFDIGDGPVSNLNFVLVVVYPVTGVVTDERGDPVPDLPVFIENTDGEIVEATITDEQGVYTFEDVPAGSYTVVVGATENSSTARLAVEVPLDGPVPSISISVTPPATTTPSDSTTASGPTQVVTVTSTRAATAIVVVAAAVEPRSLAATGSNAAGELVPAGVALVVVGGMLLLLGSRRSPTAGQHR